MSSNRTVPVGPASGPGPCTRVTIDSPPPQSMQQHLDPQHFNTDGNFDTSTSQNAYSAASATRKRALLREVVTVLGLKMCRHHTLRSGAFGPRVVKLVASMLLPLPPPWWHNADSDDPSLVIHIETGAGERLVTLDSKRHGLSGDSSLKSVKGMILGHFLFTRVAKAVQEGEGEGEGEVDLKRLRKNRDALIRYYGVVIDADNEVEPWATQQDFPRAWAKAFGQTNQDDVDQYGDWFAVQLCATTTGGCNTGTSTGGNNNTTTTANENRPTLTMLMPATKSLADFGLDRGTHSLVYTMRPDRAKLLARVRLACEQVRLVCASSSRSSMGTSESTKSTSTPDSSTSTPATTTTSISRSTGPTNSRTPFPGNTSSSSTFKSLLDEALRCDMKYTSAKLQVQRRIDTCNRARDLEEMRVPRGYTVVPPFTNDREVMLEYVKGGQGAVVQNLPDSLKGDRELVWTAVLDEAENFRFASPELRDDVQLATLAVQRDGELLSVVGPNCMCSRQVVMVALSNQPEAIRHLDPDSDFRREWWESIERVVEN